MSQTTRDLREMVRAIPDYPKTGIVFRDVTTLFGDADGLARTVDAIAGHAAGQGFDLVAGIDARGFILGGALALKMGKGFVPIRKCGKLPAEVYREEYALEYGTDEVEIHRDAIPDGGATVLLVDDLIATGGTAIAAARLIQRAGGTVPLAAFAIDLPELGGARRLADIGVATFAVMAFEGH
ncbi:adenine phosphoribosyltransferase [Acuticoccus sp. I52.16.1]|uniref:adenine phosphoribosyltransferase n=1 Tax=Acuticoccus sp. I52.16.1 TaxID=2928472 RepID=UPI001FD272FC|nr:adenine phosphoribosyltransferase [Acuticoccus sp. I52.16.1]UOM35168.1 adenine phosphoribosyltransferase [Acuticoccus sp. I52.16.1]